MGRVTTNFVAILTLMQLVACSKIDSTRRTTDDSTGTSDSNVQTSSSAANPGQQEGVGPRSITGTNLMLSVGTLVGVRIESPHFIVPLTARGTTKTIASHTRISLSVPGQSGSEIVLEETMDTAKDLTPYVRYAIPESMVAASRVALKVTDSKTSKSVTKEVDVPPPSDSRVHRVFLTKTCTADLVNQTGTGSVPNLPDGVQAADSMCSIAASEGGLFDGNFLAVIAVPGFDPKNRFNFQGPVKEIGSDAVVAMGSAHFFSDTQPQWVGISRGSLGTQWFTDIGFWSGATTSFFPLPLLASSCGGWSSSSINLTSSHTVIAINPGMGPQPDTYSWYTDALSCSLQSRILCLEQ